MVTALGRFRTTNLRESQDDIRFDSNILNIALKLHKINFNKIEFIKIVFLLLNTAKKLP